MHSLLSLRCFRSGPVSPKPALVSWEGGVVPHVDENTRYHAVQVSFPIPKNNIKILPGTRSASMDVTHLWLRSLYASSVNSFTSTLSPSLLNMICFFSIFALVWLLTSCTMPYATKPTTAMTPMTTKRIRRGTRFFSPTAIVCM